MTTHYHKVKVTGTLALHSELHIGSGELGEMAARLKNKVVTETGNEIKGSYHRVVSDVNGKPYIPGSSLRGALLNKLCNISDSRGDTPKWQSQEELKRLFGFTQETDTGMGKRGGSKVRFLGATLNPESFNIQFTADNTGAIAPASYQQDTCTLLRPGVKIDRATGAAEEGKLFHHEVVATGAIFDWSVEAENISANELALLIQLLDTLDGSSINAIGGKKNNGQGRVKWHLQAVEVVDDALYKSWLNNFQIAEFTPLKWRKLENRFDAHPEFKNWFTGTSSSRIALHLEVLSKSPLLINDPDIVNPESNKNDSETNNLPKKQFRRTYDGRPVIPGSSLKGVLRAQSERIAATIAYQNALASGQYENDQIQNIIESAVDVGKDFADLIWGSEKHQGGLRFTDMLAQADDNSKVAHKQSFNAVDRFTAGVKDGALYSVNAAYCSLYKGQCWLDTSLLDTEGKESDNKGWQALMLFTLRDAMEGELRLGSGSSKGYGEFALAVGNDQSSTSTVLTDLISSLGWTSDTESWVEELNSNLSARLSRDMHMVNDTAGSTI